MSEPQTEYTAEFEAPPERLVMSRVLGRNSLDTEYAVAVAPINRWTRHDGTEHEDWAAYVGVVPAAEAPDRRATDPLTPCLEWVANYGRKLPKGAAIAIFGYHAETYRE